MITTAIETDLIIEEGPAPEFRIAILYETQALGAAALRQCERLTEQFRDSFLFSVTTESFRGLDSETQFQKALADARGASMIFISTTGNLPASLLRWLKECLEHRGDDTPVALVEMTNGETEDAENAHRLLKEMAETNHIDLISPKQFHSPPAAAVAVRASTFDSPSHFQNWGINE